MVTNLNVFLQFVPLVKDIGTPAFRRWLVESVPSKDVHRLISSVDTMWEQAKTILNSKKEAVDKEGGGKDIMSILRAFHSDFYYG